MVRDGCRDIHGRPFEVGQTVLITKGRFGLGDSMIVTAVGEKEVSFKWRSAIWDYNQRSIDVVYGIEIKLPPAEQEEQEEAAAEAAASTEEILRQNEEEPAAEAAASTEEILRQNEEEADAETAARTEEILRQNEEEADAETEARAEVNIEAAGVAAMKAVEEDANDEEPPARTGEEAEDPEEMCKAFDRFDANKDGIMSVTELGSLLQILDAERWTEDKVNDLFRTIDSDGSGSVDLDEFVAWIHDLDSSTKAKMLSEHATRFTDFSQDLDPFSSALDGILDDTVNPRVTFKQAVGAFPPDIKGKVKKEVWLAQKFVNSSKGRDAIAKYPGLDARGASAVFLYTAESPVYKLLNKGLRGQDRASTKFREHWYPFTRLLIEALKIISGGEKVMVNRGVPRNLLEEFPEVYQKGETIIWWSFSSCTSEIEVLANDMFLGTKGKRTIFQIHTSKGAEISAFSALTNEAEHLLPPGVALKIDSIFPAGSGLTIIQCSDDEDAPDLLA